MIAAEFAGDSKGGCGWLSLLALGEIQVFLNASVTVRPSVPAKEVRHTFGNPFDRPAPFGACPLALKVLIAPLSKGLCFPCALGACQELRHVVVPKRRLAHYVRM